MGGMAIRAHAPDWPARTRRVEVDLDFATRGKDRGAFYELLAREGYTADKRHNALFGGKQAYFVDVPRNRPVDVLVDSLEMCHRFEFADRLAKSTPTLPLAELLLSKLQVVKINRKDVLDALVLLAEHPLARTTARPTRGTGQGAINVPRILSFTSNDWGWWRTVTGNLDTLDQYLAVELTPEDLDLNNGRAVLFDPGAQVAALRDGHQRRPEVDPLEAPGAGRRAPGLVPGTRGDGAQLMRVFFATDIHGSEVCWRKFLNAGKFHKADVLIMGGDMTGKAMVPIVAERLELGARAPGAAPRPDDRGRAAGDGEADQRPRLLPGPPDPRRGRRLGGRRRASSTRASRRRCSPTSSAGWRSATSGWPGPGSAASSRRPTTTCSRSTRSSTRATHLELGEANTIALDGFTLVSTGWANPTPWNTFRELPEPELRERIDGLVAPGRPTRTGRSSTSTPRRTARTSTTRRSSTPT